MPFSSTAVNVSPGDNVQIRYPTPSTWNTQVTVNVQIGTGTDPDGVTFGTKIPDALPNSFTFDDQAGFTGAFNGTSSSGSTNTFQRNTTYYSNVVDLSDFEIPIPASVSAVSNGPKNSNTNNTTAQFRIYRNGSFGSWITSVTANVSNGTGGLQPGDKVQLRVTTPDWYVTSTVVSFVVGDETFGTSIGQPSTSFTRTWGITTRAQDQNINQYSFVDYVDQKASNDPGITFTGTQLMGSGDGPYGAPGTGELGGMVTPDGGDYLLMGSYTSTLVTDRIAVLPDIDTRRATRLIFNVISGNDSNGAERPNGSNETMFVRINNGSTTRDVELIPTVQGYTGGATAYDSVEGSWHDVTVNLNADEKVENLELQLRSKAGPAEFQNSVPSAIETANANANDAYGFRYVKIYNQSTLIDTLHAAGGGGPSWVYQEVDITGIDGDVVLRATSTGQVYVSTNQYEWSQSIGAELVLGDTLYTRVRVGPNYTQKRSGTLDVFATGGDTYTRGGNSYENSEAGTYGSGDYQVTQSLGLVEDSWQTWTEVDRYPDVVNAAPIFTYGVKLNLLTDPAPTGFTVNTNYNVSGGSGNSMVVRLTSSGFNALTIIDPGYGYSVGDNNLTVTSGGNTATLEIIEYEKVIVSGDSTHNRAEPGFMYFADIPVDGLGTEYSSGTYNNLESPYSNLANNNVASAQSTVATLNGQATTMQAQIVGTGGQIRKNNTGSWGSQVTVGNGDTLNLKLAADVDFEDTNTATVRFEGPPDGVPGIGNPTNGPATPTYPEKQTTMTLVTRSERTVPYPFHATPTYLADPSTEQIAEVEIRGLDASTTATITSGVGSLSVDEVNWGSSVTILPTTYTLFVRQNSSSASGGLAQLSYRIGNTADVSAGDAITDTYRVYTRQFNTLGDFITETWFGTGFSNYTEFTIPAFAGEQFYLTLVGAGGGDGGGDVPNSTGGPGGSGNVFRCLVEIPTSAWPLSGGQPDYTLRVYPGDAGEDGDNYVTNSGGAAGGFGYAYGGDGGNAGPGDASGGGGGGGGASAVTLTNGTLIAMAGGGGGGGGAGNDTAVPLLTQYGNYSTNGSVQTTTVNLNLPGDDAPNRTGQGGGPGGGGGGYDGSAGTLITSYTEEVNDVTYTLQTNDLDATGGQGGGIYYNPTYVTTLGAAAATGQGAAPRGEGAVYIEYSQQDVTPDSFSFSDVDNATVNTTYDSDIVQITGITGTVSASSSSPGITTAIRVCSGSTASTCGTFEAGDQIGNNQYIQVQATTGNLYNTTYTVAVTVGTVTSYWDINVGPPPDSSPNAFFIQDVDNVAISTLTTSEEVTISGITVPVDITATNGAEILVEGSSTWVSGATGTTIENGEFFQVRLTSSSDYEDSISTTVTVGTGPSSTATWTVTTLEEQDSEPDSYTWIYVTGADLLATYESNTNLIQGLGTTANFIVESGTGDGDSSGLLPRIKKNGTLLAANVTTTTVDNLDTLALVYTTTDVVGETRVFNTKLGLSTATTGFYETLWSVTTAGQFGTDPTPFSFASKLATGPNVYTIADETVTIAGLANGVSITLYGTNGLQFSINGGAYNTYTVSNAATVTNGTQFNIRLLSSEIPAISRTAFVYAGSYNTGYTVQTPASVQDPINSQWYSSITPCKYIGNVFTGTQVRINTKFDGLPVGAIMPAFQDGTEDDFWGTLDGKLNSRFPSFVYCDGTYYDPGEYPLLFEVLGYEYGAKAVGGTNYFRVPDLRNRYVKGTGVIDGLAAASPGLAPTYQPTKQSGSPGNDTPGAFGGMWFVDNIGDPGEGELEQVEEPATGQPAQESQFFGIAQVSTAGYNDVTGLIEFNTSGSTTCNIGLKPEKIYEVPLHFHDLVTGVKDPGTFKGRVAWNGEGGYRGDVTTPLVADGKLGSPTEATFTSDGTFSFNLWGYATSNYSLDDDNVPESTGCDEPGWWDGSTSPWGTGICPGYEGIDDIGAHGSVTITQSGITSGSSAYNEINQYIDLQSEPFPGNTGAVGSSNARKFVTTVDIPEKQITVKNYNPVDKLKHNHWVSLSAITDDDIYAYGNVETGGTASSALDSFAGDYDDYVDLEFSALDVGIQVLPGTFTLQQTKQLIPVPEFSPQDDVPMVTPYVWAKWMIKAF